MPFAPRKQTLLLSTGIEAAYVEAGQPGRPVVILLHGYTDTSRSFFPTLQALEAAGAGLRIYALDLRGHGDSSMPPAQRWAAAPEDAFTPAQMAADVLSFMNQLKIDRAHLVGHSYGTLVAQELALTRPERVSSLVLIGGCARSAGNPAFEEFLEPVVEGDWRQALERRRPSLQWPQDAYELLPHEADPDIESWIARNWAVEIAADPDFVLQVVPETAAIRLGAWIGGLRNLLRIDNRERLRHLSVPTLVIWATQDVLFVDADQAALRESLDAAVRAGRMRYVFKTYGRVPLPASGGQESDLGHNTQWGAPETIAADLLAWVHTGRPTADRPSFDAAAPGRLRVDRGEAQLIERQPARA